MRLHIGCGRKVLAGYTNIDAVAQPEGKPQPEILAMGDKIPLEDGCAEEILAIHIFEHFYRWECDAVLREWNRLLKPRGNLIMEMPDILKCCENVTSGRKGKHPDQLSYWGLFGDPRERNPFMSHKWGWTFTTIKPLLEMAGFISINEAETQWHGTGKPHRDFRVTAVKA